MKIIEDIYVLMKYMLIEAKLAKLQNLIKMKENLTIEQKRKLLVGLKKIKENGNIGGETDIVNPDNLVAEEMPNERNVIAKTFDTKSDFYSYVNQHRGIEFTPKEQQAIINYKNAQPTHQDKYFVKYETTDNFGTNNTTVIKKLKEGGQFCWTAFAKHERADAKVNPDRSSLKKMDEGIVDFLSQFGKNFGERPNGNKSLNTNIKRDQEYLKKRSAWWLLKHYITYWDYQRTLKIHGDNIEKAAKYIAVLAINKHFTGTVTPSEWSLLKAMKNPKMWRIFHWTKEYAKSELNNILKDRNINEQEASEDELPVNDLIRITKSITFANDVDGANVLGDFLRKLDL